MERFPHLVRHWAVALVIMSLMTLNVAPAFAGLAPSHTTGTTNISTVRDADMLMAQRALENKLVAQKLMDYGVTPDQAQLRLASMSDQDLHTLASSSKGLPTGGDGTGALVGVLVVVILVIVILRLTHHDVIVR
jgi:hypothetical protein